MDLMQPRLQVVRLQREIVVPRRQGRQQQFGLPKRLIGHRLLVREGERADELGLAPVGQRFQQPQRLLRPARREGAPSLGRRRGRQRQG